MTKARFWTTCITCLLFLVSIDIPSSDAIVVQRVEVISELDFGPSPDPFEDRDIEEISGVTSADITQATFGSISGPRSDNSIGLVSYSASAAIGQFGSVGLAAGLTGAIFAGETYELSNRVIIESDEFVNLAGVPLHVVANFIIDGGQMFMEAGNASIEFELFVESENLGNVPIVTNPNNFPIILSGPQFFAGGLFEADAIGNTIFTPDGRNIGATQTGRTDVEIPLSFQSLDLGILGPGDRLALAYDFTYTLTMEGPGAFAEGMFVEFSDPLMLSGTPVVEIEVTPIPEPTSAMLTLVSVCGFIVARRWCR